MNAALPPIARPRPVRLALGTYQRNGKDYEARIVITEERLADLIQQAMKNRDGRAVAAGGGIVVLVKRVTPPRPSAETAQPSAPRQCEAGGTCPTPDDRLGMFAGLPLGLPGAPR